MLTVDLLDRKRTHFVLWCPGLNVATPPKLVIGRFAFGNPPSLQGERRSDLAPTAGLDGLWELPASACALVDGEVYHYWFEVDDTAPWRAGHRVRVTDPAAYTVDWRLLAPPKSTPYSADDRQPAAVILFRGGELHACDPGGETADWSADPSPDTLPANARLVIYELPTAWGRKVGGDQTERGVGTFRDVVALIDPTAAGVAADVPRGPGGGGYLRELGVNALELLPPADSLYDREWGYGTTHYFAPDEDLGFPEGNSWPTAGSDLARLVSACHRAGMRFIVDVVMAFAKQEPYQYVDLDAFFITDVSDPADPDAMTSARSDGRREPRNGYGSVPWRYARPVANTYDPISGRRTDVFPARQHLLAHLARWMRDFRVDGWRLDSVENVANWDFVQAFRDLGHELWRERWTQAGASPAAGADERFLVVGEELSLPMDLIRQRRLDGLWNEAFQERIRAALLGESVRGQPSFEWTVREAIDCRLLGFADGAQAVNYVTKHDVEGERKERLCTMLEHVGLGEAEIERRVKLAFACLMTAVGIPMFLAGEEFADRHDRFDRAGNIDQNGGKQVDPVNFGRLVDPWRQRVLHQAARLIGLRTTHPALAVNDTDFLHADFADGRRVMAWRRGGPGQDPVVVVANFSDWGSDPDGEYRVPNWPTTPPGRRWREWTQDRDVPDEWVGREPLFPWEAKVYVLA